MNGLPLCDRAMATARRNVGVARASLFVTSEGECVQVTEYERTDELWQALKRHPNGATAQQIAECLKRPDKSQSISSQLGRLAMYGVINRVPIYENRSRKYRYEIKRTA